MRILAYSQLLESYRSLTLESLAAAFGVTVDYIDKYVCFDDITTSLTTNLTASSLGLSPMVDYIVQ